VQDVEVTGAEELEQVYCEHGARLWRAVFAFSGDREVASDAVAEAFAQALHRGSAIRSPAAWVWRAAFRIAAGELKDRRRSAPGENERSYDYPEEAGVLMDGLARLSSRQRGAIVLHYYGGYRVKEIARILGSTPAAVKVHLSRGRKRLRQLLESSDG
jgi:RNA polymerase sigma factor (sigma-70 family)